VAANTETIATATVAQSALSVYGSAAAPAVACCCPTPPPAAPAIAPPPAIAKAPEITVPLAMNTNANSQQTAQTTVVNGDVGQDVPDRQIAHIVNGGIGGTL
jgi:hypothetical protein